MAWDCGLKFVFSVSPTLQQGPGAGVRDREDISRLELVQRLAKDGCRLLHSPLRATERPAEVRFINIHVCCMCEGLPARLLLGKHKADEASRMNSCWFVFFVN